MRDIGRVAGDSNTCHKEWHTSPFLINSAGGPRFTDVHRLLRHRHMVGIRAVVSAVGINQRPHNNRHGIIKTVQEAVNHVKTILSGPPIFHLAVPVQKAPREFPAFLSAVNFHVRTWMSQIPHPVPENSRLQYSPREREIKEHMPASFHMNADPKNMAELGEHHKRCHPCG